MGSVPLVPLDAIEDLVASCDRIGACPRCGIEDWAKVPDARDFRCGGCGLWLVTWVLEIAGYEDDAPQGEIALPAGDSGV